MTFTELIFNAGPVGQFVMVTLLFFSLASWAIVITKFRLLRKVRRDSKGFLRQFWKSANLNAVHASAKEFVYSPEARVFIAGFKELQKINRIRSRKDKEPQTETLDIQIATMDNFKRAIRKAETEEIGLLASKLPFLATTGSATPFIGLFGTVWGIMASFHDIGQKGSATLAVVAPGISEALVATVAGLAAAIPAVIFYNYFSNRLEGIDDGLANFSMDYLNLVERDLLSRI